jgi:hypothetical protein
MKFHRLFAHLLLAIFIINTSCKSGKTKDVIDNQDSNNLNKEHVNIIIVGDLFPSHPFSFRSNIDTFCSKLKQKKYLVEKQSTPNQINPAVYDSIYTFKFKYSYFKFYRNVQEPGTDPLIEAQIRDDCITLNKGIKIGMTKDDFYRLYPKQEILSLNSFSISDESELVYIYFTFQNNKITEIVIINNEIDIENR